MKRKQPGIGPSPHSSENYRKVYLKSDHWKQLRGKKLSINPVCQICGKGGNPDVHHLFYGELYNVRIDWLVTLCRGCHNRVHQLKLSFDPDFQWFSGPCRKNREKYKSMEKMFLDKVHERLKRKKKSKKRPSASAVIGEDLLRQINRNRPVTEKEQRAVLKFVSRHKNLFVPQKPKPYLGNKCFYRREHKESLKRIKKEREALLKT